MKFRKEKYIFDKVFMQPLIKVAIRQFQRKLEQLPGNYQLDRKQYAIVNICIVM